MKLEFDDYGLRPWHLDDAEDLARHADNPKIAQNLRDAFPSPYRLEHARAYLESQVSTETPSTFAIATRTGEAIGGIGFKLGEDIHRHTAELGYWLSEEYWGRGIITAAVREVTDYAFEHLDLHRIHADPFAHHQASRRVLEKVGYQLESVQRASAVKAGRIVDQAIYVRLRQDVDEGIESSR